MLSHLRILDLTDGGAAIGGQILGDLGAEVILIEPPGGLATRQLGPFADDQASPDRSLEFWSAHRGKRSVVLDLEAPNDQARLRTLAESADVWLDTLPAEARAPMGLGYAALSAAQPGMIHASITPFGEVGPKANWAATDLTVTAASNAMFLTGDADRAPLRCSVPQAFQHAGAEAAASVMVALTERARSGRGQHLDVSAETAAMASTQSTVLSHGWGADELMRFGGGVQAGPFQIRFIYPCLDGYINLTFLFGEPIGRGTARFFDWMHEEGFATEEQKNQEWVRYGALMLNGGVTTEWHGEAMAAIERFTRTKTKAELFAAAFERKLLVVPLSDGLDLVRSEQLAERDFWRPIENPAVGRKIVHAGPFARFSETPLRLEAPPPRLGEHDEVVFGEEPSPRGPSPEAGTRGQALEGLKVLDFTWVYAGPAITRHLADFGATVVKIESGSAHDALRAGVPFKDKEPGAERSGNFANINVGKLSLGLNMKTPEARDVVMRLVDWADVVVENFSPRAMKSWKLDYPELRKRKPEIIMLSSCLSGQTGPESTLAGYGTMGAALAGFGYVTGWPDRAPSAPFMAYTDYVAPRFGVAALLAAVEHRSRTGLGQHIDMSQAECSIHFLRSVVLDASVNGRAAGALGNASPHHAPAGVYPAVGEERWVAIEAPDQATWSALAEVAGLGWERDARFSTAVARLEHRDALDEAIAAWTASREVAALETELQAVGVPVHRVSQSRDCFEDPGLAVREHFITLDHSVVGPVPFENARTRFSETPARIERVTPTLGQDNQEILQGILGLSEDEVTELVIAGAVE